MPTTRTGMLRSGIEGYLRGPYRPGGGGYATPTSGSRAGLPSLFITGTRKVAEVGPRAVFARAAEIGRACVGERSRCLAKVQAAH